jgi:hypothetical protein
VLSIDAAFDTANNPAISTSHLAARNYPNTSTVITTILLSIDATNATTNRKPFFIAY